MPYRTPKRSYVLPVVTTLAVAAPLATLVHSDSARYRPANDSNLAAVPAQMAEVVLNSAPDITLPLRELTGLDLPDLHLSDLRMLPLPASVSIPEGLPLPPGVQLPDEIPLPRLHGSGQEPSVPGQTSSDPGQHPSRAPGSAPGVPGRVPGTGAASGIRFVADPTQLEPGITPDTPALEPGAISPDLVNQVGAQVKELSRDTPFSVVALTAKDLVNTKAMVRARQPNGTWGQWYETEPVDTRGTDHTAADRTAGTEPIYVGSTTAVQILVTRKDAASAPKAPSAPATLPLADPVHPAQAAPPYSDASAIAPGLTAVLIDPGHGAVDGALHNIASALPGGGPNVISRAQWGADESIRCDEPTYDDELGGVTVHHTAGRNDYSKSESAGIVRAIYTYHARTLGWCDIGYNAMVDKYGQIFEGRAGGLDRPVQGAHAGGFNENTAGVALMGNHESETPSKNALEALGQFIGWRTRVAGLDPKGYTTMWSEGTEFTPYAQGESVQLPIVFAHRDVGHTSCPGDAAYDVMDRIRDIAAGTPAGVNHQQRSSSPQRSAADLAALAELTARLMSMVEENVIAKHWAERGGPDGPLGSAESEPMPAAHGGQYAKFTNGYVYTTSDGRVSEVLGAILDRFLQLGADAGVLGLPLTDSYPVPDGLRSDFQYGSLILNELTGIVTTIVKTYNDTYQQEMRRDPAEVAAPGPVLEPAPAPAPAPTRPETDAAEPDPPVEPTG
ncbi:N-acetylmuramoyl-L-alanine amidase [Nocardia sp. NPDC005366]|uniref:N-acetylmuramoyl-L-alanine amidase n=1 Tax=Nocardia sp. NPDC005366 TaxID=3156878 RepID=UPI0033BCAD49